MRKFFYLCIITCFLLFVSSCETTNKLVSELTIISVNDFHGALDESDGKYGVAQSKEVKEAMIELRKFMFKNIYLGTHLKEERNKAKFVLEQLVNYYVKNSNELPDVYKKIEESEGTKRAVADYIAGMSDDYCLATFNKIYVPKFVIF